MSVLKNNIFTNELMLDPGFVVDPSQLISRKVPEREWFVKDIIPHGKVTLLSGDGGLGKSLLMQQLMTAASAGGDWLGLKTRKCRTFGLFCEDDNDELHRRQEAICQSMGISLEACFGMQWLSGEGIDPVLMEFSGNDKGKLTPFFDDLLQFLEWWEPELIIIDTAADTFAGNEISRIQVRNFINRALREIAVKLNATVILTSHPSVTGIREKTGLSGSTAWNNSVRSRLYLTRPDNERNTNVRVLQMKKSNYGSTEHEIRVVWENGAFHAVENTIGQSSEDRNINDEAAYLFSLEKLHMRGERALTHRNQSNYGPRIMARMEETYGVSKARLEEAQDRLMNKGIIANVEDKDGPPSKRKRHIQIINQDEADKIMNQEIF